MLRVYDWTLRGQWRRVCDDVVAHSPVMLTVYLFGKVPKGSSKRGYGPGQYHHRGGARHSFEDMKRHQLALAKIVSEDPSVDGFMSSAARWTKRLGQCRTNVHTAETAG